MSYIAVYREGSAQLVCLLAGMVYEKIKMRRHLRSVSWWRISKIYRF